MVPPTIYLDLPTALEAELFADESMRRLTRLGRLVRQGEWASGGTGDSRLQADILVTGWGSRPLPAGLDSRDRLKLVVHSAGSIRRLVPQALLPSGVRVSQASAGMAQSVAELALYMTIARLRELDRVDRTMTGEHSWAAADFGLGHTVAGSTVGVVGASRVGRAYLKLVVALGAEVLVYDPYLDERGAKELGARLVPLETLLTQSTVVALHAPVRPETRHLIDAQRLSLIRDGGLIVNTARAALVDTRALLAELRTGRLSAALDVFDEEPLPPDSAWWRQPNVLLTPHLGARTWHSRRAQGAIVIDEIRRYLSALDLRHEVLPETYDLMA
ncbi:hydroxyacid dehydrogenase [Kribbella turkmenica]|uniref:Hydroxyacid dehydrogenase n=1 Tax=Kribbella turkmenica TaxID=2530375 RepID=A0A4R4WK98_9ACTN|nr:hydroxyacid dehydrogenase [Kribbella turkmenica]TDD18891.1 hydroxyacid dehydrogenase [Kribbella turkmenica]